MEAADSFENGSRGTTSRTEAPSDAETAAGRDSCVELRTRSSDEASAGHERQQRQQRQQRQVCAPNDFGKNHWPLHIQLQQQQLQQLQPQATAAGDMTAVGAAAVREKAEAWCKRHGSGGWAALSEKIGTPASSVSVWKNRKAGERFVANIDQKLRDFFANEPEVEEKEQEEETSKLDDEAIRRPRDSTCAGGRHSYMCLLCTNGVALASSPFCKTHREHENAAESQKRLDYNADERRKRAEKAIASGRQPGGGRKPDGETNWEVVLKLWLTIYPSGKGVEGDKVSLKPSDAKDPLSGMVADLVYWNQKKGCWLEYHANGAWFKSLGPGGLETKAFFDRHLEVTLHGPPRTHKTLPRS